MHAGRVAYLAYASGLRAQGNALREVLSRAVFRGVKMPFRRWLCEWLRVRGVLTVREQSEALAKRRINGAFTRRLTPVRVSLI